ncbi:MAG: hypothetical protein CL477_20520 [Acidobacteria bacterium]|jgi:hypothetical protein|nr:hypothetical protein [Acidobacteriota bacterium]MDP7691107.1 hypothetical protein [Vicinamibacterales bacterium]HJN43454.1 hypothetical protein [Vicinamibacterales bacterium]|tara:strand:- start:824 stop:1537 length:714 start_codon:yes stop_codon:yes gene_type:complete
MRICALAPLVGMAWPVAVSAQERCAFLCVPSVKIEPTLTIEHLFGAARVEELDDGAVAAVSTEAREAVFELILAVGIPTEIPRVGFTVETIFVPFGETDIQPFTGVTAAEAGRASLRDNGIEVELELNLSILDPEQTAGWVESHFDIVDKISPGETPDAGSSYTHKLNFELDTAFLPFSRLSEDNWLHHFEVEGSLDYVATGLPKAGDVVGGERYLDDASAWSFSLVGVIPLAPLAP